MGGLPPTGTISRRCPAPAAVPPLSSLASPSVAVAHERCRLLRGGGARGPELRGRGPPPGRRAVRHRGGGGGGLHWHLPSGERRVPPDPPGDRPSARHPRGGGRDRPPRWVWSPGPATAAKPVGLRARPCSARCGRPRRGGARLARGLVRVGVQGGVEQRPPPPGSGDRGPSRGPRSGRGGGRGGHRADQRRRGRAPPAGQGSAGERGEDAPPARGPGGRSPPPPKCADWRGRMSIGPGHVALLSGVVFAIGGFGILSRRDAFGLLVSVAILLLAPVIAFAGFTAIDGGSLGPGQGEVVALAAVVVCAALTLVGAALVALLHRRHESLDTDAYGDAEGEQRCWEP